MAATPIAAIKIASIVRPEVSDPPAAPNVARAGAAPVAVAGMVEVADWELVLETDGVIKLVEVAAVVEEGPAVIDSKLAVSDSVAFDRIRLLETEDDETFWVELQVMGE